MNLKLDKKDLELLAELQNDCRQSLKTLARKLHMPITTVYERMKKLEKEKVIKGYKAILDAEKVGMPITAFIFIRFHYHYPNTETLSQQEIANKIAKLPGVCEVHIIPGEYDMLVKAKGRSVKDIGLFVIDELRKIKGVDRTLTCDVWITVKETLDINLPIKI